MNNKKQELKKMLAHFTKEELIEILSEPNEQSQDPTVHKIDSKENPSSKKKSRRGRGTRKRQNEQS